MTHPCTFCFIQVLQYSLSKLEGSRITTVLPEMPRAITDLTFIDINGKERLLLCYEQCLVMADSECKKIEKRLVNFKREFTMCKLKEGIVLVVRYVSSKELNEDQYAMHEVVFSGNKCHIGRTVFVNLGWQDRNVDFCTHGDLVVMCSCTDQRIAAINLTTGDILWKILLEDAFCVSMDPHGAIYVACSDQDIVHQVALQDGAILRQLHLGAEVAYPSYVHFHNGLLYVIHWDAQAYYNGRAQVNWVMSQFQIESDNWKRHTCKF